MVGLLALQGPEAAKYLQTLMFERSAFVTLEGSNLYVARGGYTDEDGFEVYPFIFRLSHGPMLTFNSCRSLCLPQKPSTSQNSSHKFPLN